MTIRPSQRAAGAKQAGGSARSGGGRARQQAEGEAGRGRRAERRRAGGLLPDGAAAAEGEWKVARQLLQGIVTPSRAGERARRRQPGRRHRLDLHVTAPAEGAGARRADALREELWSVKAELELSETKAAEAGALVEKAREAYERGRVDMRRAVLRRYPHGRTSTWLGSPSCHQAMTPAPARRSA
uniref:Uncharacterized protein n=1 Tax=Oryza punctata TaxID=4537 RepID=A0A0E0KDX0_ORYPU